MKKLVIVESPAKAKTINQYLGSNYVVKASFGHVRDLPSSVLGVDLDKNYTPKYVIPSRAKKVISELKQAVANSDELILATDLDREGEAIAWHLVEALKPKAKVSRIIFSEISKDALQAALAKSRAIDQDLVDAQQARRVLDRLVGYKLSPFLWKKVYSGLSAGRVQSVAVRLVVEREQEINNFKSKKYWLIKAQFKTEKGVVYEAHLGRIDQQQIANIDDRKLATETLNEVKKADYKISDLHKQQKTRNPSPPFTTSTLQQEASRKLGMSVKQTMKLAQDLYEGINIPGKGQVGLITYMRTDSLAISPAAVQKAREFIKTTYGEKYIPSSARVFAKKQARAQEAHEAIRPVDFALKPSEIEQYVDRQHHRLYNLIWTRALASQMASANIDEIVLETASTNTKKVYTFMTKGIKIVFDGFLKVYEEGRDDDTTIEAVFPIPEVKVGQKSILQDSELLEKETLPPPRFTEAMLVKELEKRGIGRPSTYAPTIATIIDRNYVNKEEKRLKPTEVGTLVTELLKEHFSQIIDYRFTAHMEDELDDVADGKMKWQALIDELYQPLSKTLAEKMESVDKVSPEKALSEKCPECSKHLVERLGRFGRFIACSDYPECKYTRPIANAEGSNTNAKKGSGQEAPKGEKEGHSCPKCKSGKLTLKEGRFGRFYACDNYPKCKHTEALTEQKGVPCPNDKGMLVQKRTKRGKVFWGCDNYPKCKTAFWDEPLSEKCPECKSIMLQTRDAKKCSSCEYKG